MCGDEIFRGLAMMFWLKSDQLLFFTAQLPHRRCERRRRLQKVGCVPPGLSVQILKRCGAQTMTAKSQLRALI